MIQKRTLIEPGDLVALQYECAHCGSICLVPLKRVDRELKKCQNCNEIWFTDEPEGELPPYQAALSLFVDYLKQIQTRKSRVKIRLELAEGAEEGGVK